MDEHELAKSVMRSILREPGQWSAQKVEDHGTSEILLCRTFGFDVLSVSSDGAICGHGSAMFRAPPREDVRAAYKSHPAIMGESGVSKAIGKFVKLLGG